MLLLQRYLPQPHSVHYACRLLLVSTDKGRLLVLRRNIVGECHCVWRHCPGLGHMQLAVEQFHNFSAAWHADSLHVFAAAAGAQASGRMLAKLAPSSLPFYFCFVCDESVVWGVQTGHTWPCLCWRQSWLEMGMEVPRTKGADSI